MSDRPELAVREGYSPPRDLPRGWVTVSRQKDGSIRIDRADPRVLFSAELLRMIAAGDSRPGVCLDSRHLPRRDDETVRPDLFVGVLLKINAVNRNVVYRITEYVAAIGGYIGEWPE